MFGQSSSTKNERSGSSKKGKKSSNSNDKNKQPQRGLGVAQLERIRMQMGCGLFPPQHVPFPNQFSQDEMRMQAAYAPMMQSSTSFAYSSPQSTSSPYVYPPNTMMALGEMERTNANSAESQPRWNPCNGVQYPQQYAQGGMSTRPLLSHVEDFTPQKRISHAEGRGSSRSSSHNSDPGQELDLELRLGDPNPDITSQFTCKGTRAQLPFFPIIGFDGDAEGSEPQKQQQLPIIGFDGDAKGSEPQQQQQLPIIGFDGDAKGSEPQQQQQLPTIGFDGDAKGSEPQQQPKGFAETNSKGKWELVSRDSGVSAMHMQLMPDNKVMMFDTTSLGKSNIMLQPGTPCRPMDTGEDCYAHSVVFDIDTAQSRPLKVWTDPWCSSGGLNIDGTLVSTGGWVDGGKSIRYIKSCDTCDWQESDIKLSDYRWYGTQAKLADGSYVMVGGRRAFNYEFVAPEGQPSSGKVALPFLLQTTDVHENNLYPFVHLAPDGNLFILANYKAILLDVKNNKIVKTFSDLPGGARNYPGSGSSAILPIKLEDPNVDPEVIICGGGQPMAFGKAEKEGIFLPALDTCGRIRMMQPDAQWEIEQMPSPRVMGDMLNLPNGQILILNGAKKGTSGWQCADEPNLTPLLYDPNKPQGQRFKPLKPSQIPRMYHSTSAVLPDGRILVAGSNTNPGYRLKNVKFPTELRVEKFSPPYLDPALANLRPKIMVAPQDITYGSQLQITFQLDEGPVEKEDIMVTMYLPPFTTHGYSMNQRLLVLPVMNMVPLIGTYTVVAQTPTKGELAPPGHYLLFVNCHGVPSVGSWIKLQ
ncbi:hypothetical protein Droror1_Dr00006113 [Drosera rotundifolia]